MLNRIILIGRLTRDPELRYIASGAAVANFMIAVDRKFKNAQGERDTDFIRIIVWRKLAEICANKLTKGRLVAVDGRLQIRRFDTPEGLKRSVAEVVADDVRFLDWPKEGVTPAPPQDVEQEMGEPKAEDLAKFEMEGKLEEKLEDKIEDEFEEEPPIGDSEKPF